jgi:hypothetical protein
MYNQIETLPVKGSNQTDGSEITAPMLSVQSNKLGEDLYTAVTSHDYTITESNKTTAREVTNSPDNVIRANHTQIMKETVNQANNIVTKILLTTSTTDITSPEDFDLSD